MPFEDWIRQAARRADRATNRAMQKYKNGLVTDEDDLTGVLIGNLDSSMDGQIGGLMWSTSIVRHRRGRASEESLTGADMVIHVKLKTSTLKYSKGVLVQAKRIEPGKRMSIEAHDELIGQCERMLDITSAAFVFDYVKGPMRCGSATRVMGSVDRGLYNDCTWTAYKFFLELFRCPVGDPRLSSAKVSELPGVNLVKMDVSSPD